MTKVAAIKLVVTTHTTNINNSLTKISMTVCDTISIYG